MVAPTPLASTPPDGRPAAAGAGGLSEALSRLQQALDAPRGAAVDRGSWRWTVRQRMAAVRDALVAEVDPVDDGWLAARSGGLLRERQALVSRLAAAGPAVLESPDVERVRAEVHRLVVDVGHHLQRRHDLAYDAVELELGGEE
ncbi:hypothetical protein ACT8ZV_14690 [Nocardioides sp. MAHUQ-72]|uniref:hypothetical protein n=1 Tax=unclassified Nocardioides TaxID=2615069 RepID=UPI00361CDF87